MLRHFERMLNLFPFSRLAKAESIFRVVPVSFGETALIETAQKNPPDVSVLMNTAREFLNPDSCYRLETHWDLWQFHGDWQLHPARVTLCCLGPEFEPDLDPESNEHLRIEFGVDTHFLPQPDLFNHALMTQSNVRSLLKLVHDLDNTLSVKRRKLWTESGENLAEKLQEAALSIQAGPVSGKRG